MKRKFGVDISYYVAWRGRECAYDNLRLGTPEQSYKLLPGYLHMLMDTNPGSVVNLEVSNGNRFQVKSVFGSNPALVIVSDRHRSINNAVQETYNLQDFHVLFYTLSSAVPGVKEYLEAVGLHRWTQSHAPSRRYNIMTTNISESLNAVLVKVRELPITALVNEIRLLCQKWFHERRTKAAGCTTMMSKDVEMKLEGRKDRAQAMGVICADQYTFDVVDGNRNYCVDMALWTCTCRKFQLDQLPCDHVLAVVRKTPYEAYDLCSLYYTREFWHETYRGISEFELQPPDVRTVAGRRRKRRLPSMGEELPTPKCSHCKERGHNRATCQNPIALHPTDEASCSGSNLPTHQPIHPSDQHSTPQL
ncbi:hypothetical protein UlMin_045824 [Ulmus minor]